MAIATALADISPTSLERISSRLPSTIEDALDFPVVKEMIAAVGEGNVKAYVEFELMKLANLVSVGGNLNDHQVVFIAQELIRTYPNETLVDFKLCFQRAASGQYNLSSKGEKDIFRLDSIVVRRWMDKYLEEKYQVVEDRMMREKENQYDWSGAVKTTSNDVAKTYLKKWMDQVEESKVEVEEKYLEPARRGTGYKDPHPAEWYELRDRIRRTASEFYKDRYSFSKMEVYSVKDQEVFAESQEDAMMIYELSINKH